MYRLLLSLILTAAFLPAPLVAELDLHWSTDGNRCWYRIDRDFFVVDVQMKQRQSAFDTKRLAAALTEKTGEPIHPDELRVEQFEFAQIDNAYLVKINGITWQLELADYSLTKVAELQALKNMSRLFLPPRNSGSSSDSTNITIRNAWSEPVELIWVSSSGERRSYGTIAVGQQVEQHTYVGHAWLLKATSGKDLGCFFAERNGHIAVDDELMQNIQLEVPRRERPRGARHPISPDRNWTAFVRDQNLWVRSDEREWQLTTDGTAENSFQSRNQPNVRWAPDSRHLVALQTTTVPERQVQIVESSPKDQLQPRTITFNYRKPGDDLPHVTVRLFRVEDAMEILVPQDLIANQWDLRFRKWSETGDRFWMHYNQRGHQTLRELEVETDGSIRPYIEEASDTFIQYSDRGKLVYEELNHDEILWASERSGWNHLYRYQRSTGEVLNQVTTGNWNVKHIEKIDREAQQIWFYAVGVHKSQDPYHEHFCCVNFDGTDFRVLTDGDGTHQVRFEQDGTYFTDTYSRVDLAPVHELRDSVIGELISELHRGQTAKEFGQRRLTERFVAKGRDGKTDIWGIIHWPIDFDENKKYPVVENIYAGPHDHHVPKAFRTSYRHQHQIADAGMIVVQIDGMGTAWRSKAFHDVCHKNLRDAGFPDRIAWMKAAAKKYPQMDLSRVGIYGGSAGGQNAMAALLWHNDFYKVAVADCGCHDNRMDKIWWNEQWMGWPIDDSYTTNSNMENAHLLKGDLMLLVGELDRNVDPASTRQVVHQLIKHNKDFEFVLVAGAGHGSAETPWASLKRLNFLRDHLVGE